MLAAMPQKPSAHGRVLGAELTTIADAMAPLHPDIPERCATCAFRHGTFPNGCASTLSEALNCVIGADPSPFHCHHGLKDGEGPMRLCSGYLLVNGAPFADLKAGLERAGAKLNAMGET